MAKYVRYLEVWPEPEIQAELTGDTVHLPWMYERYAFPLASNGVSKVNVHFTGQRDEARPHEVLGIADVRQYFDLHHFAGLTRPDQQRYYLDRIHEGVLECAREFGWEQEPLEQARSRMLADNLRLAFLWQKPVASPDRGHRVQGFVEAGPRTSIWILFTDRDGTERSCVLLARVATGSMDLAHFFGKLEWLDVRTLRVTRGNGRDYWLCDLDGTTTFHFPRAESGDPHGLFELGRMYLEGWDIVPDRERGMDLIRRAATAGFKHAVNYLNRLEREEGESPAGR